MAGAKRLAPGSPEAKKRDEIRAEGTLDEIVRRSLALAAKFEKLGAADGEEALAAQRVTRAVATMFKEAISALKARGTIGDILPQAKGAAPLAAGPTLADLDEWLNEPPP